MIDVFKNWISSMLCIGIFVTFITLIIPKNKMRKYIYSLIGIVTIFTLVSPIIKYINTTNLDNAVNQVMGNISSLSSSEEYDIEKYQGTEKELLKKEFIENLKQNISSKLLLKNINVKDIQILLDDEYNIEKIEIKIKQLNKENVLESINYIIKYINEEYDIDYSKITVVEGE